MVMCKSKQNQKESKEINDVDYEENFNKAFRLAESSVGKLTKTEYSVREC